MSLDATCHSTADNTHETDATPNDYAHDEVNHLGRRTCDWTQRLKPLKLWPAWPARYETYEVNMADLVM